MTERSDRTEHSDLREPAGHVIPGWEGITPRTTRRQEQLDDLMDDPSGGGIQPPGDGNIDHRNRESAAEGLSIARRTPARGGAKSGRQRPARARGDHPGNREE